MTQQLPPPFIVGETYEDRDGKYKVISADGERITFERADGSEGGGTIEIKARVHRNIFIDRNLRHSVEHAIRSVSGNRGPSYTLAEVEPILARLIENYSQRHKGYMTHQIMVEALLKDGQASAILERIQDNKTMTGRAGVLIAGVSQAFSQGHSAWNDRFEGERIDGEWAFRVRRRGKY